MENTDNSDPVFQEKVFIDVTFFDVVRPDDPLGYACSGTISILSDASIIISDMHDQVMEKLHVSDIVYGSNNINNYDPNRCTEIAIMTSEKDIRLIFEDKEMKLKCWDTFCMMYENERK